MLLFGFALVLMMLFRPAASTRLPLRAARLHETVEGAE
jgi:hypothetical protein